MLGPFSCLAICASAEWDWVCCLVSKQCLAGGGIGGGGCHAASASDNARCVSAFGGWFLRLRSKAESPSSSSFVVLEDP